METPAFIKKAKSSIGNALGIWQSTEHKFSFDNPFAFSEKMTEDVFVDYCIENIYKKILTDCFAKAGGIRPEIKKFYWDSVVKSYAKSNTGTGIITKISKAMAKKSELFWIYKSEVLRDADAAEAQAIQNAFNEGKEYKDGFWFSLKEYTLTDILKVLYSFQYVILSATYTGINVSKAIQVKIKDLRNLVADSEKISAIKQAAEIVAGMKDGKGVILDVLDMIETAKIDMQPTEIAIKFINGMIAFYLNAPMSYINGILTQGISTTGESDSIAVERCLEGFFNSIFKPITDEIFELDIVFISDNWRLLLAGCDVVKTLEMTSDDNLPPEVKQNVYKAIFKDFWPVKETRSPETRSLKKA
ncbi:MAG: hypothetical protein LBU09_00140 [Endomicrobium sp.]|jgi:hypothetical protein|nr:hypothetical protein [Endomicrobium sp.]